jgi:ABC-2 type transport system ATP-binding protein
MTSPLAIEAAGLGKRYGATIAVSRIELAIAHGAFFGLLGPNGAGKTSLIHVLSTLIRPSTGEACVAGYDVRTQKLDVRANIGVVFQDAALDRTLSVAENLRFAGLLNGLPRADIRHRSSELLELFGLVRQRDQVVASLSGGMRRALDIARGIIHRPKILFLDEPTVGLDLPNRRAIWRHVAHLRAQFGITVFLSTHYLEEASDCGEVAFLSAGSIVRRGDPRALMAELGAYILEIETDDAAALAVRLAPRFGTPLIEPNCLHFRGVNAANELGTLQADIIPSPRAVRWRRPNLNDVFMWVNAPDAAKKRAA